MDKTKSSEQPDTGRRAGASGLQAGGASATGFRDPTGLSRWTAGFLYAEIAMSVLAVGSGLLELGLLVDMRAGAYDTDEALAAAASANDSRQAAVSLAQVGVAVASGVLVLMWIHRAAFNVRRLGATGLRFTPGWCVGWYFIPIANLWKPYQAMKEIWRATIAPLSWQEVRRSALLPWWWLLWLLNGSVGQGAARASLRAEEINELIVANVAWLASDLLGIPLCLVFLAMMRPVVRLQTAHAERIGLPGTKLAD